MSAALLQELLAERVGVTREEMESLSRGDPDAMQRFVIAKLARRHSASQRQNGTDVPPPEAEDEEVGRMVHRQAELLDRMASQLLLADQRSRIAASVFGACACWGLDRHCAACHGAGGPGFADPSPEQF